ncbi:iron-containing alcohol dehydrogenase [Sagittula stellata]|nr:iron-containing alcohol dehydrogenase [Sagittula stellata]
MSLTVPARTVSGRGSRSAVLEAVTPLRGAVIVVRGRSVPWVDTLVSELMAAGRPVVPVIAAGEPSLPHVETLIAELRDSGAGIVLAIGGGSVIDLGKALAALVPAPGGVLDHLEVVGAGQPLAAPPLPLIAVPTTAGTGAEATKNAVIDVPDHRRKVSLRDPRMVPGLAVLDAELTDGAPWPVTLSTGMDALTQLIEAYLSVKANPETDALCRAAIPLAAKALFRLSKGEDLEARQTMLVAAHLSGIALANAGLGAVHGLAGVLGGHTKAPHGAICARLLPEVLKVNRQACAAAGRDTKRFGEVDEMVSEGMAHPGETAADLLSALTNGAAFPGLGSFDAETVAKESMESSSMKGNPVQLTVAQLVSVLGSAV